MMNTRNIFKSLIGAIAAILILSISACGGGGGGGSSGQDSAYLPTDSSGAGGGSISSISIQGSNVAPIVIDQGPPLANGNINLPFVSVTICKPGTDDCRTIDHVLLDTGSYGLRIIEPGVLGTNFKLPAVTSASGKPLAECAQFVSGFTWGSVNYADVKIAGEFASSVPIEIISNSSSAYANVPDACSGGGNDMGTVADLGANGILGVGLASYDCGSYCLSNNQDVYYQCDSNGTCASTGVPLQKQVINPVALFSQNNNGVVLDLPSVPLGGASLLTGNLIFGIGTQDNNQLAGRTVYRADNDGYFSTTYKGTTYSGSFLDSGSNGLFFPDRSITRCRYSTGFFCPSSPLTLTAITAGYDGSNSNTITFTIENVDRLGNSINAASIGGSSSGFSGMSGFDWGLPFFFGRTVFVALEGRAASGNSGPFWAY